MMRILAILSVNCSVILSAMSHFLAECSWTMSTRARALSTGVCGRTPWPRLKMWPGRPAAWSRTAIARRRSSAVSAKQGHRVEIALDRAVVADHLPGVVEPHAPIDADHRGARFGEQRQELRVAGGEVDHGDAGRDAADDLR